MRIAVEGRQELVTAVGNLLGVQPGERLRLRGRWERDRRFGDQFRVESYETVLPATVEGIERYLGSGLVAGVGKGLARRLVEHFGPDTLTVIDEEPNRLAEVEGIGPIRTSRILKAWKEQRRIREVMVFLQSHSVSTAHAIRIFKAYGSDAVSIVRADPYRLATDIFGIGFLTADRIARDLGIDRSSPRRAEAGVLHLLGEASDQRGHIYLPREDLVAEAEKLLDVQPEIVDHAVRDLAARGMVVLETIGSGGEAVYTRPLHAAEAGASSLFARLLATPAQPLEIDLPRAIAWFEERAGIALAPGQRDAIGAAIGEKVLVITGGPGTGKTTLILGIIQILGRKGRRILLAAPTGRAAKRMSEATGLEARTIHRLLEFSPKRGSFERNETRLLDGDLIVIDEFSMVDMPLCCHLLKAVSPHAQLVIVGDIDQLPSVGPGCVLRDLIASERIRVVRLTQIFRQAEESRIVVNAHRVNQGKMPLPGEDTEGSDFFFVEREEPETILTTLKRIVTTRIPSRFGLDPIDDIQVLTPMHRGLLGATNLNAELQHALNPHGASMTRGNRMFRVGDRVLQTCNNYDLEVFNGDIGRVEEVSETDRTLVVRLLDRRVRYDYAEIDELSHAYACSVHKAQGNEFPCVVIPIHTQHYVMLQRNLLYTAITRGRRLVILIGSRTALATAIRNRRVEIRHSRLAERLRRLAPL